MTIIKMWFSMKKKEIEFKLMLYTYGIKFMDEKSDLVKTVWKIYESIKDLSMDELRNRFIEELAGLAHQQAQTEKNKKEENNDIHVVK